MLRRTNPDDGLNPAFAEEQAKLDEVVRYIEEDWVRIQRNLPAKAAYQDAANEIQRILLERQDSLDSALRQPYFGRLDYIVTDGPPVVMGSAPGGDDENPRPPRKTVYLGITSITERGISSWTAPIAKLWYTPSRQDGYTAPAGHVSTLVDLKRYLRIRNQKLVDVNDIFRRLLLASSQEPNQALTDALSQTGAEDRQLQIIIETIEPEQYESISNTSDKVLVVQGAAGSGKARSGSTGLPTFSHHSTTFRRGNVPHRGPPSSWGRRRLSWNMLPTSSPCSGFENMYNKRGSANGSLVRCPGVRGSTPGSGGTCWRPGRTCASTNRPSFSRARC